MKRSGPPKRKTPMARTGRLRPRNPERARKRQLEAFGPQAALCRRLPCCVCGDSPCDPHHLKSRGAGGTDRDTVPLCRTHHDMAHQMGAVTFWSLHQLDSEWILDQLRAQITPPPDNGATRG
jgi:hypothetical protein